MTKINRWRPIASALVVTLLFASPAHAVGKLELFPNPTILVLLLVVFGLLVVPMNGLIFKPLFKVLDERRERIEGARRRADQLEQDASESLARYRSAVNEARDEAERERRSKLDEARREHADIAAGARDEAERESGRARGEIENALTEARASLRGSAESLAREAAERILGRQLT